MQVMGSYIDKVEERNLTLKVWPAAMHSLDSFSIFSLILSIIDIGKIKVICYFLIIEDHFLEEYLQSGEQTAIDICIHHNMLSSTDLIKLHKVVV